VNSGIYKYLDQQKQEEFYQIAYLPGLAYLVRSKNPYRGILFLSTTIICLTSVLVAFCENKLRLFQKIFSFLVKKISGSLAGSFEIGFYFLFFFSLLSLGLYFYLVFRTKKDLRENFREKEKDQKPLLFASSVSSAYLLFICIFFTLLIYVASKGLFTKKQKFEEIRIENLREFIENPNFIKSKNPPKVTKRLAKKSAINSGQSNPQKKVRTGQKFSSRKVLKKKTITLKPKPKARLRSKSRAKPNNKNLNLKQRINPEKEALVSKSSPYKSKSKNRETTVSQKPSIEKAKKTNLIKEQTRGLYSRSNKNSHLLGDSSQASVGGRKGNAPINSLSEEPVSLSALVGADYSAYKKDLNRRIYAVWIKKPKTGVGDFSAKIVFVIHKNGSLKKKSLSVIDSNGSGNDISLAKSSVVEASPYFRPLPAGSPKQVRVELDFSYSSRYK